MNFEKVALILLFIVVLGFVADAIIRINKLEQEFRTRYNVNNMSEMWITNQTFATSVCVNTNNNTTVRVRFLIGFNNRGYVIWKPEPYAITNIIIQGFETGL